MYVLESVWHLGYWFIYLHRTKRPQRPQNAAWVTIDTIQCIDFNIIKYPSDTTQFEVRPTWHVTIYILIIRMTTETNYHSKEFNSRYNYTIVLCLQRFYIIKSSKYTIRFTFNFRLSWLFFSVCKKQMNKFSNYYLSRIVC